jgi:hypothetical protein
MRDQVIVMRVNGMKAISIDREICNFTIANPKKVIVREEEEEEEERKSDCSRITLTLNMSM